MFKAFFKNGFLGVLLASSLGAAAQSVTIGWNSSLSPSVAGYMVYSSTDGVIFKNQIDAGSNTYLTFNNLPSGDNYFEVSAYDTNYNLSAPSPMVKFVVPAPPGSNQSGGSGGNRGIVGNSVLFTGTPRLVLTNSQNSFALLIGGNGTLAPARAAKAYVAGKKYSLTAVPGRGSVFDNWMSNGVVVSALPHYSFTVESNLAVQANFITNPFVPVIGTYYGLFYVPTNAAAESSGAIMASVTSAGVYNAKLYVAGRPYSFSGSFSVAGVASKTIVRPGLPSLTVQLQLDLTNGPMTGTVSDGTWTSELVADPAIYSRTNHAPMAGKYTMAIPGSTNEGAPFGNGYGSVLVSPMGAVTFTGALGDGTPVTASSLVSSQGQWPFYAPLYNGGGSILGWLAFTNGGISGQLGWFKNAMPTAKMYAAGFTNSPDVVGSAYHYTNGAPVLGFTDGQLVLTNADLVTSITNQVVLNANNQATNFAFIPSLGVFKARAVDPVTEKPIVISGAVLQDRGIGAGYSTGTNGTGAAYLYPAQ
jgi:hypothetical protein